MRYNITPIILITLLFSIFYNSVAQKQGISHLRGRVIDASSDDPLSYANIKVSGSDQGTATNENGGFVLTVDSFPIRLTASHIGYRTVERRVTEPTADSVVVRLKKKPVAMDEVIVEGRTGAYVLRKALKHVTELSKRQTRFTQGVRGFYRQKTGFSAIEKNSGNKLPQDTTYTEYLEIFANAFTSPFGIRNWSIEQARYARAKGPEGRLYSKNFSSLTRQWFRIPPLRSAEETEVLQPFHFEARDYFSFNVVGHVEQDGRELIKIAYKPTQGVERPAFAGNLYIDSKTYGLRQYDGSVNSSTSFFFDAPTGEVANATFEMSASFRPHGDRSAPVLEHLRLSMSYDHLVAEYRRHYETTSTFFVYDYNPGKTFGTSTTENDYAAIDSVEYDPEFWRNNPVLARTPIDEAIIRSFEETGGFGPFVEKRVGSE